LVLCASGSSPIACSYSIAGILALDAASCGHAESVPEKFRLALSSGNRMLGSGGLIWTKTGRESACRNRNAESRIRVDSYPRIGWSRPASWISRCQDLRRQIACRRDESRQGPKSSTTRMRAARLTRRIIGPEHSLAHYSSSEKHRMNLEKTPLSGAALPTRLCWRKDQRRDSLRIRPDSADITRPYDLRCWLRMPGETA